VSEEEVAILERAAHLLYADTDPTSDRASDVLLADSLTKLAKELRAGHPVPGIGQTLILAQILVRVMEAQ